MTTEIKTVTRYQTSDGQTHESVLDATNHQRYIDLVERFRSGGYWSGMDEHDIVNWFLDNFTLTEKKS